MMWSDFVTLVNDELGVDAGRKGIANLLDRSIRNGVMDLQRFIRAYRQAQTTTFLVADLTVESQAMLGTLPAGAKPKAFYIYSTATGDDPNCKRHRLDVYPWEKRQDLICGRLTYTSWWNNWCCGTTPPATPGVCGWTPSRPYVVSLSPMNRNFLIYPPLNTATNLLLVWDGFKIDFINGDTVPFPAQAAEAVAAFVKWKIALQIDKNIALSHEHEKIYMMKRLSLLRDEQEAQDVDGKDEEYTAATTVPSSSSGHSFHEQNNAGGNSEIAPTSGDHVEEITFTGGAGARICFVDTAGRNNGDRCTVLCDFPATPGIIFTLENAMVGGTAIYQYTTDGSGSGGAFELYFDGAAWQPLRVQVPA